MLRKDHYTLISALSKALGASNIVKAEAPGVASASAVGVAEGEVSPHHTTIAELVRDELHQAVGFIEGYVGSLSDSHIYQALKSMRQEDGEHELTVAEAETLVAELK